MPNDAPKHFLIADVSDLALPAERVSGLSRIELVPDPAAVEALSEVEKHFMLHAVVRARYPHCYPLNDDGRAWVAWLREHFPGISYVAVDHMLRSIFRADVVAAHSYSRLDGFAADKGLVMGGDWRVALTATPKPSLLERWAQSLFFTES